MQTSQDLLNVANALVAASRGEANTTFMSIEHAKAVWRKYLEWSGYDVPKKVNPEVIRSTFTGGTGSQPLAK